MENKAIFRLPMIFTIPIFSSFPLCPFRRLPTIVAPRYQDGVMDAQAPCVVPPHHFSGLDRSSRSMVWLVGLFRAQSTLLTPFE